MPMPMPMLGPAPIRKAIANLNRVNFIVVIFLTVRGLTH
jgi:hypothetical protein